eukprot:m51a1_g8648 putative atp-binding cassette sub-family b member 5 (1327) ;mRNA; r:23440-27971
MSTPGVDKPGSDLHVVEVVAPPFSLYAAEADPSSKPKRVPYTRLFRFADGLDKLLVAVGVVAAIGNGVAPSVLCLFMGDMTDAFVSSAADASASGTAAAEGTVDTAAVNCTAVRIVWVGAIAFVLRLVFGACLTVAADRQSNRIRKARYLRELFRATLSQEVGWFDAHRVGELTAKVADVQKINDGINEQLGLFFMAIAQFVSCLAVGLFKGWKMTLVLLACVPLIVASFGFFSYFFNNLVATTSKCYAAAGQVAEEILCSIRTAIALGIQRDALQRYDAHLVKSMRAGFRKGLVMGCSFGSVSFILFSAFGLAFWYGAKLVMTVDKHVDPATGKVTYDAEMTPGQTMVVFFVIMSGATSLSLLSPVLSAFGNATGAAAVVFAIIDRKSLIDPRDTAGEELEVRGDVEFRDITFRYPTRPEVEVLRKFSLRVRAGQTVALVGPSGCGKSTIVGLLERFYDVEEGHGFVLVDGHDVRSLSLQHYRKQIGAVSQEPVLFATTLGENIALGTRDGGATPEQIAEAARSANAHAFIEELPAKYDTLVGERGAQLSGGQKQRVAIARALIRRPKILIFDEATSALDTQSEATVQAAIDEVSHGRTCFVIAHRLSTVRNADLIVAMREGRIVEQGTHEQLMQAQGLYYSLVQKQQLSRTPAPDGNTAISNGSRTPLPGPEPGAKTAAGAATGADQKEEAQLLEEGDAQRKVPIARTLARAMRCMAPNWAWVAVSALTSMFSGAIFPLLGLLISQYQGVLVFLPGMSNLDEHRRKVNMWSLGFVLLGVAAGVAQFVQNATIEVAGERLARYLRFESFKAMLRQDAGFFDDKCNSTGVLATRLATDATLVHGLAGQQVCVLIQLVSSISAGIAIGFSGNWRLALIVCAFLPIMLTASFADLRFLSTHQQNTRKAYEKVGHIVSESLSNIRTVLLLCRQDTLAQRLAQELCVPSRKGRRAVIIHSLADALHNMEMYLISALIYWYGAKMMSEHTGGLDFTGLQRSLNGIMFGAMAIGNIAAQLPAYSKAVMAAHHIFELLDRTPLIPPPDGLAAARPGESDGQAQLRAAEEAAADKAAEAGAGVPRARIEGLRGEIELRDVEFAYPSRPGVRVLAGLSLVARPRQTLAVVGHSGCGKSTVIALLERLYAPSAGAITLDGVPLASLDVAWLRAQMGLVSQEPNLFAASVAENIRYGKPGATLDEVVSAARMANAHDFISGFPAGYETQLGDKGVTLSGGQKQRIAIARALVRDPRILLLDEATAALDTGSETVVQQALDRARDGRTTVVVAHRLATIANADLIVVVEHGRIVEAGTHHELLRLGGHYYDLACNQMK